MSISASSHDVESADDCHSMSCCVHGLNRRQPQAVKHLSTAMIQIMSQAMVGLYGNDLLLTEVSPVYELQNVLNQMSAIQMCYFWQDF